ncbi:MAG: hypothetical protein L3J30_03010 [Marinosulfonomonas sp.]|nr:hypothetical protein [Marinosulfonomonas sp.]
MRRSETKCRRYVENLRPHSSLGYLGQLIAGYQAASEKYEEDGVVLGGEAL